MVKKNKTLCFDADICEYLEKQGNMSEFLSILIREKMEGFPNLENISFELKKFKCPSCKGRFQYTEGGHPCPWCAARGMKTVLEEWGA
jgi:rubrerythrin